MAIRIPGIVAALDEINRMIQADIEGRMASGEKRLSNFETRQIFTAITTQRKRVERLAKKRGGVPGDLPAPSFRAYRWLKFLSSKKNLAIHLAAHARFLEIALELQGQNSIFRKNPEIRLTFVNSSYLFKGKKDGGRLDIEIHEGFILSDDEVKRALIRAASGSHERSLAQMVRGYAKGKQFKSLSAEVQQAEKPNRLSAIGKAVDLVKVFHKVNREYFSGEMNQPRLVWSARRSTRRMGSYDPESDTVTVNRRLDSKAIPPAAVEYIMFHELLHRKLGIRQSGSRRYAHTAAFKKAEVRFREKEKADRIIRELSSRRKS